MRRALGIAALTAFLLALLSTQSSLWDRDEPRFAQATVEMLASGNRLFPTFNGELRPDKPILIYWLMSVPMGALGASALGARLVSCLAIGLASLATFRAARALFDLRCAWCSQLLLALAPLAVAEGSLATTDALLLAALSAFFALFVEAALAGLRARHFLGLAAACAAGQLAKGPVALALCVLPLVYLLFFERRSAWIALAACLVGTLVFLAWAIPADAATQGEFARRGLGHHVIERSTQALEGHGGHGGAYFASLPYYVPVVLLGCLPASALLPVAWERWRARRSRASRLLFAWSVPCFVLMTLVATKLPHYVLPLAPAVSIAAARVLTQPGATSVRAWRTSALVLALGLALLSCGFVLAPELIHLPQLRAAAWTAAACTLLTLLAAVPLLWRGRAVVALRVAGAGQLVLFALLALGLLPALEATKISPRLAAAIRAGTSADTPVARLGYLEPSLDFALDRVPIRNLTGEAELRSWCDEPGAGVAVVPRERLLRSGLTPGAGRLSELAAVRGFDLSRGRELEVVALRRAP